MTTTYSTDEQLLVGDITFASGEKNTYRVAAQNEIFAKLGQRFTIPLQPPVGGYEYLILSTIEIKLASGRLIMSKAAASEDKDVQAYGYFLIKEALGTLEMILGGQIDLPSCAQTPAQISSGNAPSIIQGDAASGVDAFYNWATVPGPVPYSRGGAWWG